MTAHGAVVRSRAGVDSIPIGTFFVEIHPNLYIPAGYQVTPALAPEALARAFEAPSSHVLFIMTDGRAWAVDEPSFEALETALLEAPPWEPAAADAIESTLAAPIDLEVTPVGRVPRLGDELPAKADG
jgi:hypothetical protein